MECPNCGMESNTESTSCKNCGTCLVDYSNPMMCPECSSYQTVNYIVSIIGFSIPIIIFLMIRFPNIDLSYFVIIFLVLYLLTKNTRMCAKCNNVYKHNKL